jgi:hypothetical protein
MEATPVWSRLFSTPEIPRLRRGCLPVWPDPAAGVGQVASGTGMNPGDTGSSGDALQSVRTGPGRVPPGPGACRRQRTPKESAETQMAAKYPPHSPASPKALQLD